MTDELRWIRAYIVGEPEFEPEKNEDDELDERINAFVDLGFEVWTAFVMSWNNVSPSDVRERWLKKGATLEQATAYFVEVEDE